MQQYREENAKLSLEGEKMRIKVDNCEKEIQLLRKQVNGLSEDNDRINRMYQVVEKEAFMKGKVVEIGEKSEYAGTNMMTMKTGPSNIGKQGKWKTVDDDYGTGRFGPDAD